VRTEVGRGGDLWFCELVGVQLAHVAEEEDEDADALEAGEKGKEAEPEDGDGREASGGRHVREKVVVVAGGEDGEDDE
jgi:hypothetical protein